jgi:hypothetical protein
MAYGISTQIGVAKTCFRSCATHYNIFLVVAFLASGRFRLTSPSMQIKQDAQEIMHVFRLLGAPARRHVRNATGLDRINAPCTSQRPLELYCEGSLTS